MTLPMRPGHELGRVDGESSGRGIDKSSSGLGHQGGRVSVGLERIEAFELLIEDGERLELLGAKERSAEPSLDLVGFGWRQGRVGIVEVSIQLE